MKHAEAARRHGDVGHQLAVDAQAQVLAQMKDAPTVPSCGRIESGSVAKRTRRRKRPRRALRWPARTGAAGERRRATNNHAFPPRHARSGNHHGPDRVRPTAVLRLCTLRPVSPRVHHGRVALTPGGEP
jgi:hypothetical protein